jgi:hypothetical protein
MRGDIHGGREPRSRAGQAGWRPGRTTGAIADRVASQVSLACAPRPPGLRRGGTRNPATPPHPQRHPCRRGAGLRRPGHYPPGTAPPPDRWDVHAALEPSPTGHARATLLASDAILAFVTVNVVVSGILDWNRGAPLLLPVLPRPFDRWHLLASVVLVVYLVVHVSRRWRRLRRSTIR